MSARWAGFRWPRRAARPPRLRLATGPCGDPVVDRRWRARRLALDVAAAEAIAALDRAGIPSILLKGPVTAARLYPGEFRPYLDVDLIVPPAAHRPARRVLADLGYRLATCAPTEDCHHRPTDGCAIDLHRTLGRVGASPDVVWRVLAAHREPFRLHGCTVSALDGGAFAFHLALHAVQDGALKAKPGQDLARAIERLPAGVWVGAARVAAELDAVGALVTALRCMAAGRLADRLGLPRRVPLLHRVTMRRPVRGLVAVASVPPGGARAALRRWLLPSAAERAARLSLPDARGLLPGAPPAVRYAALRLEVLLELAIGVAIEIGRQAGSAAHGAAAAMRGFARLPSSERLVFLRCLLTAVALELALRFVAPNRLVAAWAAAARRARHPPRDDVSWPRRRRLAEHAAGLLRPGGACLVEALLLWREALAAGEATRLIVGVRTEPAFLAHAWVERLDGSVPGSDRPVPGLVRLAVWGPDGMLETRRRPSAGAALGAGGEISGSEPL